MEDSKFFEKVIKLANEEGIVDFMFVGIKLSGESHTFTDIGEKGFTLSNHQRLNTIIGEFEREKVKMIMENP